MRKIIAVILGCALLLTSGCSKKETAGETSGSRETASTESSDGGAGASSKSGGQREELESIQAVYLGVYEYGEDETWIGNVESFQYRFEVNGEEQLFRIDNSQKDETGESAFAIQNQLKENYSFELLVKDGVIYSVAELPSEPSGYQPPVVGKAGERTLSNFVKTSLMPVGVTLYISGGGWNWQNTAPSIQARSIGISDSWVRFFREQDVNYTFCDVDNNPAKRDPQTSYFPFGDYNEYYYAGLDCSGFVNWAIYNTFETESGNPGYAWKSTTMAKKFYSYGWGTYTQDVKEPSEGDQYVFKPGDIMSMYGHVYISLGTCSDGSILIVHSTCNVYSRTGQPGGGLALGVVSYTTDCEAYRLADEYMSKYYPEWYERYSIQLSSPGSFCYVTGNDEAGLFRWDTTSASGISDPDHIQDMTPAEVLKFCYGE
ncbi:MAG: CHAP domain-containing protein [Clostridiales bacterium]|nr:CHAP domain-containing protein [Clostridiales bacterium]